LAIPVGIKEGQRSPLPEPKSFFVSPSSIAMMPSARPAPPVLPIFGEKKKQLTERIGRRKSHDRTGCGTAGQNQRHSSEGGQTVTKWRDRLITASSLS
jgi:hypothetical protein